MKEELQINPDEFDLSYYTYGLSVYKNMPLMEPLETKEVKKIYEFVIALDTSYSIDEALAKRFVSNTYSILSTSNMFYKTCKVHIIQCDDRIRKDDSCRVHFRNRLLPSLQGHQSLPMSNRQNLFYKSLPGVFCRRKPS